MLLMSNTYLISVNILQDDSHKYKAFMYGDVSATVQAILTPTGYVQVRGECCLVKC